MASGQSLGSLQATAFVASSSNGTSPKVVNNNYVHQFDPTTQQSAEAGWVIPANYSATTGITFTALCFADTATTGAYLLGIAIERDSSGGTSMTSDSFATTVNAASATTTNGSLGVPTATTIAVTNAQIDGAVAGDRVRIRVLRIAADASDTMSGLLDFVSLNIVET